MSYWLLKTEPKEYSWHDLENDKITVWDGVKAPAALKNLARMKKGDLAFIYHSGKERAIIGISKIVSQPYPDPEKENAKLLVVKISAFKPLQNSVKLEDIKKSGLFPNWELIRLPRLSVVPVTTEQWNLIIKWGAQLKKNTSIK